MPFQDMKNDHVPDLDRTQTISLIDQIDALLAPYLQNLSEEENTQIGSISEQNKLFVNKVNDFHQVQPALDSPDVDWPEFEADYSSRQFYELIAIRLEGLAKTITETRRLHDYDNYHNGLLDYKYAQYKDSTQPGAGYDTKVAELGQFFQGGGPQEPTPDAP